MQRNAKAMHLGPGSPAANTKVRTGPTPQLSRVVTAYVATGKPGMLPPALAAPALFAASRGSAPSPDTNMGGRQGRAYALRTQSLPRQNSNKGTNTFYTAKSQVRF